MTSSRANLKIMLCPNEETRINVRAGIISIAEELSDIEYQRDVWVHNSRPGLAGSFVEVIGGLFDDFSVCEVLWHASELKFNVNQEKRLRLLVDELFRINKEYASLRDRDIIELPEWQSSTTCPSVS
jgi:hypothetical protein